MHIHNAVAMARIPVSTDPLTILCQIFELFGAFKHYLRPKTPRLDPFSEIPGVSVCQAFLLPVFFPFLTSLLLAQQQQRLVWINQASIEVPAAIHMNANILPPRLAPIFSSETDVNAFCIMMNITVAMTVATVMKRAAKKVKMPVNRVSQREKTAIGFKSIITKDKQAPVRNRPNIQCETVLIKPRISVRSVGSATEKRVSPN